MRLTEYTVRSISFLDWRHDCLSPSRTQPVVKTSWRMLTHNSTEYCWTHVSIIVFLTYGYASILVPLHPHHRLDSQTQTNQAVFKLQAAIGDFFRNYLSSQGFVEIHSPKMNGAASESGASVFKISYFKGRSKLPIALPSISLNT